MDENRMKVLEMLADGKVSVEEAERLLDKIETTGADEGGEPGAAEVVVTGVPAAERPVPKNPKFLRVCVDSSGGDKVNIRVPMGLIKTGIKLGALVPQHARNQLEGQGIDLSALSQLDPDELVEAIAALTVDVESDGGDTVHIFCE